MFGPQKGADAAAVDELERRLEQLADRYRSDLGVDVRRLRGGGAAGGLAGGLAALGARLVPGAELVAEAVGLDDALESASLAITGEGRFVTTSLAGKVRVTCSPGHGRSGLRLRWWPATRNVTCQWQRTSRSSPLVGLAGSTERAQRVGVARGCGGRGARAALLARHALD